MNRAAQALGRRAIGIAVIVTTFAVVVIVAWGMTVVLSRP